tara:strand:- start:284 stop:718 length:435 start_codon:yes stop_codon:yes gene_type:complete
MVKEHVEKAMKKAVAKFAEKLGVEKNKIAFFIHTKPSVEAPELLPKYFHTVNGVPVKKEDGSLHELRFTQDILGKKFDLLGTELMAKQFLSSYFKTVSEEYKANANSLYIMIKGSDQDKNELALALYKDSTVIKNLDLEQIFGE